MRKVSAMRSSLKVVFQLASLSALGALTLYIVAFLLFWAAGSIYHSMEGARSQNPGIFWSAWIGWSISFIANFFWRRHQERLQQEKWRPNIHAVIDVTDEYGKEYRFFIIYASQFKEDLTTEELYAKARQYGYLIPSLEAVPLLLKYLTPEEMERLGLFRIFVMHEPVIRADGHPYISLIRKIKVDDSRLTEWDIHDHGMWGYYECVVFQAY